VDNSVGTFFVFLFWFSTGACLYCYVGYPVILKCLSLFYRNRVSKAEIYPDVSILIAAYNEEKSIRQKLETILQQDYPADKIKIFVGSDGSTDDTDEIVQEVASRSKGRIFLIRNESNQGKNTLYNKIFPLTNKDSILFLSDATSIWPSDLIRKVVQNFNDPLVGAVGVKLCYSNPGEVGKINDQSVVKGQQNYWEYETFIRKMESRIFTMIGVSGATFALRRELYVPVDPSLQEDFVTPLNIIERGYRVVWEGDTCVFEETNSSKKDEFGMRVRVATRAFFSIWYKKRLLNLFHYPLISWQLFSHKLLRLLMPCFLIIIFCSNLFVMRHSPFYLSAFVAQTLFYGLAVLGPVLGKRNIKISQLPYYFTLGNSAYLFALIRFLQGKRYVKWRTVR
jgi:cellulose synthase/poly-beta-1,6-N-acetylglucosamine synthase-like glycosyltransferase